MSHEQEGYSRKVVAEGGEREERGLAQGFGNGEDGDICWSITNRITNTCAWIAAV